MTTENGRTQTPPGVTTTDPEFTPPTIRKKRQLTAQYKARVLEEVAALPDGQTAAYLRREGPYSSQIAKWRKQREAGKLAGEPVAAQSLNQPAAPRPGRQMDQVAKDEEGEAGRSITQTTHRSIAEPAGCAPAG